MGNFRPRSDDRPRGRPDTHRQSFSRGRYDGGGRFGGGRDREGRRDNFQKTEVTCSKCGKQCLVPFRPTQGKPVYCSECFGREDSGRSSNNFSQSSSSSSSGMSSEQFKQINAKLDKILGILETIEVVEEDTDEVEETEE